MNLVKLTRVRDAKTDVFVHPERVTFVEAVLPTADAVGTYIGLGAEGCLIVDESVADVVALMNKAMAVPVMLAVPQQPPGLLLGGR